MNRLLDVATSLVPTALRLASGVSVGKLGPRPVELGLHLLRHRLEKIAVDADAVGFHPRQQRQQGSVDGLVQLGQPRVGETGFPRFRR